MDEPSSQDKENPRSFLTEVSPNEPTPSEPTPVAIPIIVPDGNKYIFEKEALEKVIKDNGVEHLPAVVISVAGAFRKGKSFLLNFFLRYLSAEDKENWLGDEDTPLKGFSWKGGSGRDTTGVLIWHKIFKVSVADGKEVAVLLMDTQGAFDGETSVKECVTIFALSTMITSVQVYNLSHHIQEDDLQHLALFTEYGRLASKESEHKPFQTLQFLVRDWSYPYDFKWGADGGQSLLEKKLKISQDKHPDLTKVREHIDSCFENLNCFLMPHPGLTVATKREFDGSLRDMEKDFKIHIKSFVESLLEPERLKVKSINGSEVSCKEIVNYFVSYVDVYNQDDLPEPRSMLQATAEVNNMTMVNKCRDQYSSAMDEVCKANNLCITQSELQSMHEKTMTLTLEKFDKTRKLGGSEFASKYREDLQNEIEKAFEFYISENERKLSQSNHIVPTVGVALVVSFYLLALFFSFFMTTVSNIFYYLSIGCLFILGYWAVRKVTGVTDDNIVRLTWGAGLMMDHVLSPLAHYLVSRSTAAILQQKTGQKVKTN